MGGMPRRCLAASDHQGLKAASLPYTCSTPTCQERRSVAVKVDRTERSRGWIALVATILVGGSPPAVADVDLMVNYGTLPEEIVLRWTGGVSPFGVFRSTDPAAATDSANRIATTDQSSWTDSPPPATVWFYQVIECASCTSCGILPQVAPPGGRYSVTLGGSSYVGSCGGTGPEGLFSFTIPVATDVFLTTHAAGDLDTVVYVRRDTCDGAEVACNDDADGRMTSTLALSMLAAGTYTVFVDTDASITGAIPVDLYLTAPGATTDRCGRPGLLPAGTTSLTGSTCGFSVDYAPSLEMECSFAGGGGGRDRVYYFYLPTSRSVTFSGCASGTNYDQTIYVRTVCTDDSASGQLACNDDGCEGGPILCGAPALRSAVNVTLPAGLHYLFVDGNSGSICSCGNFAVSINGL